MNISKKQRETHIFFNEKDDRIEVVTHNTALIKKLTALGAAYPECCEITCVDTEIGRYEFSASKHNFTFRVMRPYTAERKRAMQYYAIWHDTISAVNRKEKNE